MLKHDPDVSRKAAAIPHTVLLSYFARLHKGLLDEDILHYELEPNGEVQAFASQLAYDQDDATPDGDAPTAPLSSSPKGQPCVTIRVGARLFGIVTGIISGKPNAVTVFLFASARQTKISYLGYFEPGKSVSTFKRDTQFVCPVLAKDIEIALPGETYEAYARTATYQMAFLMALLNEPGILKTEQTQSRQERRAYERKTGVPAKSWGRVVWDMSKESVKLRSEATGRHGVALHYARGHFRRAESHYQGAMQRPDAFRPEDRELWWQWIEGVWKGHPAFGFKKSVHAPKLSTGELARRQAA